MLKEKVRLVLVDNHPIVLEGLKALFGTSDNYQIQSFSVCREFRQYLRKNAKDIDLVLIDTELKDTCGIDICREIKNANSSIKVIALSSQTGQSTILQLLQYGASGLLLKSDAANLILDRVEAALSGDIVFSDDVKKILASPVDKEHHIPALTKREKQLLELLAQGKTTTLIAQELFLSKYTVDTYRKNLLQKFGVKNTSELLMLLVQEKLL